MTTQQRRGLKGTHDALLSLQYYKPVDCGILGPDPTHDHVFALWYSRDSRQRVMIRFEAMRLESEVEAERCRNLGDRGIG